MSDQRVDNRQIMVDQITIHPGHLVGILVDLSIKKNNYIKDFKGNITSNKKSTTISIQYTPRFDKSLLFV